MKTILIFAGTRPEIIKMAPIIRELRRQQAGQQIWQSHFCFSGQHDELARPFLKFFEIEPDSELALMESGQSLGRLSSRAAAQFDDFFEKHPDARLALVQGDTTSAFVAALSAFYHRVPVGHIEAGLRTSSINEPFPEELNRRLITQIAQWHYAPTEKARRALIEEKITPESIVLSQNTGIDSFLWALGNKTRPARPELLRLEKQPTVLVTIHRRENIGAPLERISAAVGKLAREFKKTVFVLPLHKNLSIAEPIKTSLAGLANVMLIESLDYGDLIWVMQNAELIMTDSGGIQEEAPSLQKAVLVLRNETERPEAVEHGSSFLVGSDEERIVTTARDFLNGKRRFSLKSTANPFGDGRAAVRIVDHLLAQI